MQNLPKAEVYQEEVKYMPWGIITAEVENYVTKHVPKGGTVLDLLCGTGYLAGELQKKRPDVKFLGVDLESDFIDYAKKQYPEVEFQTADVLTWISEKRFDVVLCMAGLHHIPYDKQKEFICKISGFVKDGGFAIVADPYIDDYSSEQERKLASAKLGYEYLATTIKNGAPDEVIKATEALIPNDIFLVEFKNSVKKVEPYFGEYFSFVEKHKTWPKEDTQYGDYYFVLKN